MDGPTVGPKVNVLTNGLTVNVLIDGQTDAQRHAIIRSVNGGHMKRCQFSG